MFVIEKNIPTIITSKMGWGWSDGVKIVSATKDEGDHCTLGPASIIDSLDLCRGGMLDLFVITEEVRTRNVVFERGVHFVGMIHLDSLYPLYCCTAWFVCCVFVSCFPHVMRLKTLEKLLKRKGKTWLINTAYIIHYWLSYVVFSEFSIHHCPIPRLQEPMDQGVDSTVVRHLKVNQLCRSWQRWCGEMRHWRWPTVPSSWMLLPSRKECRLAIVPAFIYHGALRSWYKSFEMMQNAFLGGKEFGIRVSKDKWNMNVHFFKEIFIERYWESVSELVVCLGIQLQLLSRLKILYGHEFPLSLAGMDRQRVQIQEACP